MIRSTPRVFVLALVVLVLAGCGFHLRNAIRLPDAIGPVRVVSRDPYSPLAQSLARALDRAGAVAARANDPGATTLRILSEQWGDTPLSVDSRGRSQEYTLRHAVVFVMRRADGTVVVPQQAIELSRDYLSIPNQSIGVDSEREILAEELRREMAAAILRRIDAASQVPPPTAVAAPQALGAQPLESPESDASKSDSPEPDSSEPVPSEPASSEPASSEPASSELDAPELDAQQPASR